MKKTSRIRSAIFFLPWISMISATLAADEIIIKESPRQRIDGFGYSIAPGELDQAARLPTLPGAPLHYLRLPVDLIAATALNGQAGIAEVTNQQYTRNLDPFVKSVIGNGLWEKARKAGIDSIVLAPYGIPAYMLLNQGSQAAGGDKPLNYEFVPKYALLLADLLETLKTKYNLPITATSVAAQTNHITPDQWLLVVRYLREILDSRGMRSVEIVAPDWPEADPGAVVRLRSIQSANDAWQRLDGLGLTFSAGAPAIDYYTVFCQGSQKGLWILPPASGLPDANQIRWPACIVGDLAQGASAWMAASPSNAEAMEILRQLSAAFPAGTQLCKVGGGVSEKLEAAAGRRSDGSWALAIATAPGGPGQAGFRIEALSAEPETDARLIRIRSGRSLESKVKLVKGFFSVALAGDEAAVILTAPRSAVPPAP